METAPDRTGDNSADLDVLFDYIHGLEFERRADKERIRGALQELAASAKTTFTVTNHTERLALDCDVDEAAAIADFVGSVMTVLNTLKARVAEVS